MIINRAGQISVERGFLTLAEGHFPGGRGRDDVSSSGRWGWEVKVQGQLVPGLADQLYSTVHSGSRKILLASSPVTLKAGWLMAQVLYLCQLSPGD